MTRIAINGLGRIGRCVIRALVEYQRNDIELVAVNGPAPADTHVHLLGFDSVHGRFPHVEKVNEDKLIIGGKEVALFHERNPENLPWGELNIDVVFECTGAFKKSSDLEKHLKAGAKKVLISAPAEGAETTIVHGVNNEALKPEHKLISVGSCTTNCLAPVAKVLDEQIGIERGFMTTVHAYTNDQNIMDANHKDLRRARAAALSMIPTSTGAAKAIGQVLPQLQGKLDGTAIRVPTPNVSLVDLCFDAARDTSPEEVNQLVKDAAQGPLKGVLSYNEQPLVSIDYTHQPESSCFDATGTKVQQKRFVRVASWYDNEWGFSVRMLDIAALL